MDILNYNNIVLVISLIFGIAISKIKANDCDIIIEAIEGFDSYSFFYDDFKDGKNCCNRTVREMNVICDDKQNVTGIKFGDTLSFTDDLSDSMNSLKKLKYLTYFEFNEFHGTGGVSEFPTGFGNLPNLKTLVIKESGKFMGEGDGFPDVFNNLDNLEKLEIISCKFKGNLPKSIGNLKKLKYLNIQDSGVTGYLPYEFKNLVNLEELYITDNKDLHGYVPPLPKLNICNYDNSKLCSISSSKCIARAECSKEEILETNKENHNPNAKEYEEEGVGFIKKYFYIIKGYCNLRELFNFKNARGVSFFLRIFIIIILFIIIFIFLTYICTIYSNINKCKTMLEEHMKSDNDSDYDSDDSESDTDSDSENYIYCNGSHTRNNNDSYLYANINNNNINISDLDIENLLERVIIHR